MLATLPFSARVAAIGALTMAAAAMVRFAVIEPPGIGWFCNADGAPWWCLLRQSAIVLFQAGVLGIVSLFAGLAAVVVGGRTLALVAVGVGAAGLVLYSAGPSAAGVLLGILRALRL